MLLLSDDLILHIPNLKMPPKHYQSSTMNLVKLQYKQLIYRNLLRFYTVKTNYEKEKCRKQSNLPSHEKE